jgi:hypothetical protein
MGANSARETGEQCASGGEHERGAGAEWRNHQVQIFHMARQQPLIALVALFSHANFMVGPSRIR